MLLNPRRVSPYIYKYSEFIRDIMYLWSNRIVQQNAIRDEKNRIIGWRYKTTKYHINDRVLRYLNNKGYGNMEELSDSLKLIQEAVF